MKRITTWMKMVVVSLLFFSCHKETVKTFVKESDSAMASRMAAKGVKNSDSTVLPRLADRNANSAVVDPTVSRVDGIVRIVQASSLPITLNETFTKEHQGLTIKIEGFHKAEISASLLTKEKDFNIRINQIRTADGNFDGPFGKALLRYKTRGSGEVWLIIGKDLMADGATTGKFEVEIK